MLSPQAHGPPSLPWSYTIQSLDFPVGPIVVALPRPLRVAVMGKEQTVVSQAARKPDPAKAHVVATSTHVSLTPPSYMQLDPDLISLLRSANIRLHKS